MLAPRVGIGVGQCQVQCGGVSARPGSAIPPMTQSWEDKEMSCATPSIPPQKSTWTSCGDNGLRLGSAPGNMLSFVHWGEEDARGHHSPHAHPPQVQPQVSLGPALLLLSLPPRPSPATKPPAAAADPDGSAATAPNSTDTGPTRSRGRIALISRFFHRLASAAVGRSCPPVVRPTRLESLGRANRNTR